MIFLEKSQKEFITFSTANEYIIFNIFLLSMLFQNNQGKKGQTFAKDVILLYE
jgi:hypothetical protein